MVVLFLFSSFSLLMFYLLALSQRSDFIDSQIDAFQVIDVDFLATLLNLYAQSRPHLLFFAEVEEPTQIFQSRMGGIQCLSGLLLASPDTKGRRAWQKV